MPGIVKSILVGGSWGLGLGAAAVTAAILARPLARLTIAGYLAATRQVGERAKSASASASARLQDIYEHVGEAER
ncbi:MAG: hypothetical protein ACM3US_11815 [Sphingomonadaceae bacterium]